MLGSLKTPRSDLIGKTLAHYEVTGLLGEGGMGVVYSATDTKLRRDVAIKVLPDDFAQDQERLDRFEREAHILASLNHTGIASIYGLEESGGTRFLVMELVPGETLQIDSTKAHSRSMKPSELLARSPRRLRKRTSTPSSIAI